MTTKNKFFVISGPSGSGKGTLVKRLLRDRDDVALSVSATTRKPRAGEIEGKHYYFISDDDFKTKVQAKKFLEWARVHNYLYGTLLEEIERLESAGKHAILEIDPQGAFQAQEKRKDAILIFIKPPTMEDLEERLKTRATDTIDTIKERLKGAKKELEQAKRYKYVIINDDLKKASKELVEIIKKESEK